MEKMTKDMNNNIIEIGDIVKIEGSPNKSDNANYIVAQDGTSDFFNSSDLLLYRVSKHKNGYSLSRGKYNLCFYPLVSYSNKYKYAREELDQATIEILEKNDHGKVEIKMCADSWENPCEEGKEKDLYYRCAIETAEGKEIEDISFLCSQVEKLQQFLSNITLKTDEKINIFKACNTDFYYKRSSYEAIYKIASKDAETVTERPAAPEEIAPVNEEPAETAQQNIIRKYYAINEKMAYAANMVNSFREYKSDSATETYKYYCDKAYDILDQITEKKPEQAESAARKVDYYCRKLAEYYTDYYRNEAACPSVMISGGSNFPVRKKEKQNSRRDTLMNTWNYLESYLQKINNILTCSNPIKSGDPTAIEQIETKTADLEHKKETLKEANKYYRKNGTLNGFMGFTESEIEKKMDFLKRINYSGTSPFDTTNTNAEIKRLKTRLENLEKAKAAGTKTEAATTQDGTELFKVVENTEIMRLQLLFDDKPEETTRDLLKKNGFRWSPKSKAWQRQLTDNARYSLQRIKSQIQTA